MTKKLSGNTKNKVIIASILLGVMFVRILFETTVYNWTIPELIIPAVASPVIFVAFIMLTLSDKAYDIFNAQGIFAATSIAMVTGALTSYRMIVTGDRMVLLSLIAASALMICVQRFETLPVAVIIGGFVAVKHDSVAVAVIPAAVSAAYVCLSEKMKKNPVWQKLVFAVLEIALFAEAIHAFYIRRFTFSIYNFKGEIWDSIAVFVFVAVLLAFTVIAIKNKRTIGEILGYFLLAVFGILMTWTEMKTVVASSVAIIMMLTVVAKNGTIAETATDDIIKRIKEKTNKA